MGKSKLSPHGGTTIPRLELCAAVLATELAETIMEHLDVSSDEFIYHSDSKVVLGYLNNRARRFYTYVANRVQAVLKSSKASQWQYVPTQNNPADCGTRCNTPAQEFPHSMWIAGPAFLKAEVPSKELGDNSQFNLINETEDRELRPEIHVKATMLRRTIASRFEKFSTWKTLVRAFSLLRRVGRARKEKMPIAASNVVDDEDTKNYLIQMAQEEAFGNEINMLKKIDAISNKSCIIALSPVLDNQNILRVGGRISKAPINNDQQHPVIIPRKSHVAQLLVNHFHTKVQHQGRLVTESAFRTSGLWIIGAKRLVSSVIQKCVTCRKLRGNFLIQRMADLPADRVTPAPPFTAVGIDAFGPWTVVARKTRGGHAESKRWAILFTCLAMRAVHIEVIEDMSSSAFINALRRFVAVRGPVKEIRSDRGSNFVGATDHIKATGVCVEKGPVHEHLQSAGIIWTFKPPYSSHMGGACERLIGIARRILDDMLLNSHAQLTHEVLCTLMCEVGAIINSRPVSPISYDSDNPEIITPAMLLTQKKEPLSAPSTSVNIREMYESQWKYVQILSNTFWKRWKDGYLQSLQSRRKWTKEVPDMKVGDVVLLRDKEQHRNHWPLGIVVNVFPSDCDDRVRTVEIRVAKDKKTVNYVRPVSELILLVDSV